MEHNLFDFSCMSTVAVRNQAAVNCFIKDTIWKASDKKGRSTNVFRNTDLSCMHTDAVFNWHELDRTNVNECEFVEAALNPRKGQTPSRQKETHLH